MRIPRNIIILAIFVALVLLTTWPLMLHVTTHIPGYYDTEESLSSLWNNWRINHSVHQHQSIKHTDLLAYPWGLDLYLPGELSISSLSLVYITSLVTDPVLGFNIIVLVNLILSAFFAYLLVRYVTKSIICAIIGGMMFFAFPYQFGKLWQQLGLTFNQWIPLALLSVVMLFEKPSLRNMIFCALSVFLLLTFDYTVAYLGILPIAVFIIFVLQDKVRTKPFLRKMGVIGLGLVTILSWQIIYKIINVINNYHNNPASRFNIYHRPFENLFSESARPLSYFLPSPFHPVFGDFTKRFIGSSLYGYSETDQVLYLGWTVLILAFYALKKYIKSTKKEDGSFTRRDKLFIKYFAVLGLVAWLFSQPPWWSIFGLKLYMPSFVMYKILPMYRAYCRFGIIVMLAVSVLASFGLKLLLNRFKSQLVRIILGVTVGILVLFDFWNYPPYKVIDVSKAPEAYMWLKNKPGDFAIAEYPLDTNGVSTNYQFYQMFHHKPMINGTNPLTYPNKVARAITNLSDPKTAGVLKSLGVKYVLVHQDDYINSELVDQINEYNTIRRNPGLLKVNNFPGQKCPKDNILCKSKTGPIDVYEVVAAPIEFNDVVRRDNEKDNP